MKKYFISADEFCKKAFDTFVGRPYNRASFNDMIRYLKSTNAGMGIISASDPMEAVIEFYSYALDGAPDNKKYQFTEMLWKEAKRQTRNGYDSVIYLRPVQESHGAD